MLKSVHETPVGAEDAFCLEVLFESGCAGTGCRRSWAQLRESCQWDQARRCAAQTAADTERQVPPVGAARLQGSLEAEATRIRQQLLVSLGMWPMWEKTELKPVVTGTLDRGDYTVDKVYFASRPGTMSRASSTVRRTPRDKFQPFSVPHGHWPEGRFYDAGEKGAADQIASGAEDFLSGARSPLQARFVQLARMGCLVFHYDMVGNADSQVIEHRTQFNDVAASLRLQNKMGLQTWNSIRAVDYVLSLPEVDAARIGVTGASGGGTQTFMLCALDPRPAAAFLQ